MAFGIGPIHEAVQQLDENLQKRLDSIAATITTDLASIRDDIRRDTDTLRSLIDQTRRDLAALHTLIETRHSQPAPAAPEQPAVQEAGQDASEHEALLSRAAGIAYAEMVCHRDTWAFLVERAARHPHFRLPAAVEEKGDEKDDRRRGDGRIEAALSGRTLIASLEALWETRQPGNRPAGTRHFAAQIYDRISAALGQVAPDPESERGVTRIVIDDRPTAESSGDAAG